MGRSGNEFELDLYKSGNGWKIVVEYLYYKRTGDKQNRTLSSITTYTWWTDCKELVEWFQRKKTKVFYTQLRVLCRQFGETTYQKF